MFIISEKSFKNIYHALQIKHLSERKVLGLAEIKVNMNKPYLERLDQFIGDLISVGETHSFVTNEPGRKFEQSVSYALARKAFQFILEVMEKEEQVIPQNADTIDITKEVQHDLFKDDNTLNVSVPEFSCFYTGGGFESNAGPGLGRAVIEQENCSNPSTKLD